MEEGVHMTRLLPLPAKVHKGITVTLKNYLPNLNLACV